MASQQPVPVPTATVPVSTVISLSALIFGTILLGLGAGFAFGWPFALLAVGAVVLVFGFILGLQK